MGILFTIVLGIQFTISTLLLRFIRHRKKTRLGYFNRGEALRGKEKLRSIHPLLYKHKRSHYRDPLSLAPPLFANLFVNLPSLVV